MATAFRHNHYVPEWYQKRFLPREQVGQEIYYLDLHPEPFIDPRGTPHLRKNPKRLGFRHCFAETDLYTRQIGSLESTEIEQRFFGAIDRRGREAVNYYADFAYPWDGRGFLNEILIYMSTQKLRTPKGLGWLSNQIASPEKNRILRLMLELQQLHCAIWAECIWLIADASLSETKFITSDHPVTVYNRGCGPRSDWCRGKNDPDISLHGTHTIFPLSLEKILILTNLSWVRNPYQSPIAVRPNPNPFRSTIFKVTDIQTLRHLSEEEVREINFIIKSRAHRYIAADKEEWLYPEQYVSKSQWNTFGNGYLLMPDPRAIHLGGTIMWGNNDGTGGAMDEYGRHPWDSGFERDMSQIEADTLYRFKGEFARLNGPYRRGRSFPVMSLDKEKDDDEYHAYHLGLENKKKRRH